MSCVPMEAGEMHMTRRDAHEEERPKQKKGVKRHSHRVESLILCNTPRVLRSYTMVCVTALYVGGDLCNRNNYYSQSTVYTRTSHL